jgi:ribosome-associated toxin RatA of RatAB toxin-antitoxin module
MREVTQRIHIDRPPEDVFKLISDPDRYPEFFSGLTKWSLLTDKPGFDARYRVLMKVGSIEAGGVVRVTYWREPTSIRWCSEQGIEQEGRWRLRPTDSGGTDVELTIGFNLSGAVIARLVERMTGRIVARNMWASLLAARRLLETD